MVFMITFNNNVYAAELDNMQHIRCYCILSTTSFHFDQEIIAIIT